MVRRHAAALLCGAAAVHLADLLFHGGLIAGLSGFGQGRVPVLLIAAVPALVLLWLLHGRVSGSVALLLGASAGYALDEWLLLPRLGWGWTTAVWVVPAGVAVLARGRAPSEAPARGLVAGGIGSLALGALMGFSLAFVRPFLLQHVGGTRHGLRIAVMTALLGLLAGAALGQTLKRRIPRLGVAALSAALAAVSFVTADLLFPKASAGLVFPMVSGGWSYTWWGRSILASWAVLGLLTVAFGLALPLLDRRRLMPFLLAGLCAGTWLGERAVDALDRDPAAFRALADRVARHPPNQPIEAAAIDPDGIWTRYRTRTLLEVESVGHWQATRFERGALWRNLEAAELEPFGDPSDQSVLGHVPGQLGLVAGQRSPLRAPARKTGDHVLPSSGYLASGLGLRDCAESLRARAAAAPASLRVWCDPRALTPAGLRSLLATWRAALPEGRFSLLIDGYNGPLLGVRVGAAGAHFHVAEQLTLLEGPIASAFRGELGPPSTFDRPILEWEAAPEPSPFPHPRGDAMLALAEALVVEDGSPAGHVLRGLVLHAGAQVVRPYVVSAWDHVAVPEGEIAEYMTALRKDDRFPPLIRHLQIVFEVLYRKREFAVLVRHAEEAVARRPDVFGFHRTLGKAYHDLLDHVSAIEELSEARALRPEDHDVTMELSRALGAGKRWKEAVLLLEEEEKRSSDPAVLKGLAIALVEAGELDRAEAMLKDLNARFPADVDLMRALDRLRQMKK